ncbi:phosphoadenosine phosphosulfate reductase [Catalinimonas alkaloidigena]|uniref:Adenosine 5'-phosphosulfate reductase n=1 Tax=Catalinimonas alkaloidigena TaxID=1075417 RepID=A0A1G9MTR9_9BACT|nr:phosphoadenylyl-sulfate reductase [Catalinimonas alkaloidigena]SDL77513.1 phosphoadenosine phosphosulfate reductase [Catalinimonas alkaloidigena]
MTSFETLVRDIRHDIADYRLRGLKVFATSSFQTNSVPLLHILSQMEPKVPIFFLNTGYHFPETLQFRDTLMERLDLQLITLQSPVPKAYQKGQGNQLLYTFDPEHCCHLNKVQPLEPILASHDVWISGVRGDQSRVRAKMHKEETTPDGVLRYHPMLGWTAKMVYDYIREFDLPKHPLEPEGYISIGCEPCTRKFTLPPDGADDRGGRWFGLQKSECGLHTELIKK